MREPSPNAEAYSAAQVADILGVDLRSVRKYVKNGDMFAVKLGARVLIPRTEIDRILAGEPRQPDGGGS